MPGYVRKEDSFAAHAECQPAINAKCISDGVDALRVVLAFLHAILNPDTTETIV